MTNLCNFSNDLFLEIEKKTNEIEVGLIQCIDYINVKNLECIKQNLNDIIEILTILKYKNDMDERINELINQLAIIHIYFNRFCNRL
ncbi:hypothetical protein AT267_10095 [Bacillus cereus]|nr:hypothetical protein AT267_10095 [Bacillus cereus]